MWPLFVEKSREFRANQTSWWLLTPRQEAQEPSSSLDGRFVTPTPDRPGPKARVSGMCLTQTESCAS